MSDASYIYGENNGASYSEDTFLSQDGLTDGYLDVRTHWDPRVDVRAIADTVQVGVVPPSTDSTREQGVWDSDDGQFLSLSRAGVNRLIVALREARDSAYGKDE